MDGEKILEISAQLEEELSWRLDEMRLLKNQLEYLELERDKERLTRALVVMLYAHFEGFCKEALSIYIESINRMNIKRKEANSHLVAASMVKIFKAYEDRDRKCQIFKRKLPNDSSLHQFFRQVDFVESIDNFLEEQLTIPESIINTESNLRPIVLQKLLYQVGLSHDAMKEYEGDINRLVNIRNEIAHGRTHKTIKVHEYEALHTKVVNLMEQLKRIINRAIRNKEYVKS